MRSALFLFAIFAIAFSQHIGVDRMYGDLPGYPVELTEDPTWQACEKLYVLFVHLFSPVCFSWDFSIVSKCSCNENEECEIWAYGYPNCPAAEEIPAKCWLKTGETTLTINPCRVSGVKKIELRKPAFKRVRLGDLLPNGWMRNWLNLQANSLSGNLFKFWHDIQESCIDHCSSLTGSSMARW